MPPVLSDLVQSKKFVFVLAVTVVTLIASYFSVLSKPEVLSLLGILWPVYLGAQGVADVGDKLANAHYNVQSDRADHWQKTFGTLFPHLPAIFGAVSDKNIASVTIPTPLKKGDKVIHLVLGPDDVGMVQEDQDEDQAIDDPKQATVRVLFASNKAGVDLYDRLDLLKVSDDYVGPTQGATAAAVKPTTPVASSPVPRPSATASKPETSTRGSA